jgi:uncharacterized protein (TIGR03437 family)
MSRRLGNYLAFVLAGMSSTVSSLSGQNVIGIGPRMGEISGSVYGDVSVAEFQVEVLGNASARVKFRLDRVSTTLDAPNFLVVSPSAATTPARIAVGLNPTVARQMRPGIYGATSTLITVDESPPSSVNFSVRLTLTSRPPSIVSVANAASHNRVVSPGMVVSIFGSNLGPGLGVVEYSGEGLYPTAFGNTAVTFSGVPAPLLYLSPGRIDAVIPSSVSGQSVAQAVVSSYGQPSPAINVPVAEISPAIYTTSSTGSGQGDILNFVFPNYSQNGPDNPAAPGSVIVLFATGAGPWDSATSDASISLVARPFTTRPVSLTIGGLPATIFYAGAAPYQTIGKLQINAIVPETLAPGSHPVVLAIGNVANEQQKVTVAVR